MNKSGEKQPSINFIESLSPALAGRLRKNRRIFAGDSANIYLIVLAVITFFLPRWLGINCAATLGVIAVTLHNVNRDLLGNFILWIFARRGIERRPDRIVDPADPGVWFVSVIPRNRWATPTWDRATDVGFLKIDDDHGWLLFEGDQARYRIPARSILRVCEESTRIRDSEEIPGAPPMYKWSEYYLVAVILPGDREQTEACFLIMGGRWLFTAQQRYAANVALKDEILRLKSGTANAL